VFRSNKKHWVLKEVYTRLLVIIIGFISWLSKSVRSFCSHMASYIRCYIYSSSVVLKAIEFCFLLHQEIMEKFMVRQQPDVLFSSTVLSSQSVSAYPANSGTHWRHISGHIQLCLIYISIHVLLLSSESISVDSWID
jgi:hypothetical protein